MPTQEPQDATELRTDPILDRWVLIAEGRARRPNEFVTSSRQTGAPQEYAPPTGCPFCPGEESSTPPSVYEINDAPGDWQLRVVPNKYPAVVRLDDNAARTSEALSETGGSSALLGSQPAWGAHEVIIETRRHVQWMGELAIEELQQILAAYRQRLRHWRDDRRLKYGLIFKNAGASSGASLAHLHSQFIALAEVPLDVAREIQRAEDFFHRHGMCPYCEMVKVERDFGGRIVLDSGDWISFCPYASLQPFETWFMPAGHRSSFETSSDDALRTLAEVLLDVFRRIERVAAPSGYNVLLRTAPWRRGVSAWCHWRIEILPRSSAFAGFELATGVSINDLFPERAAERLRTDAAK